MIVIGATREDIEKALQDVNTVFDNNVTWNREPEYVGKTRDKREKYRLTLRVVSSKGKGAKIGYTGRRSISACWHVHGTFQDALPWGAEIKTTCGRQGSVTVKSGNRWLDFNVGSMYRPMYASEMCECGLE